MSNLRKIENLFRSASVKVGSDEAFTKEEELVFQVLDRAFESEDFETEDTPEPEELRPPRKFGRALIRLGVVAAVVLLGITVYFVSTTSFRRQILSIAHAANEEGDLHGLLASLRQLSSLHLDLDSPLRDLAQRLDEEPLSTIGQSLLRGENYAALEAAAAQIALLRKARKHTSAGASDMESLLSRYLVRQTDVHYAHTKQRVYSLILIARIFLENPVDSALETPDSLLFRKRLESIVKEPQSETQREEILYAISGLSCCGTFRSALCLHQLLGASEVGSEERRLLLLALERIHRRSYLCPELDDLGKGSDWLKGLLIEASRDSIGTDKNTLKLLRDWLDFQRRFGNGGIYEEIRHGLARVDELHP